VLDGDAEAGQRLAALGPPAAATPRRTNG